MLIQTRPQDSTLAAHDRMYRALRAQVMHGELAPGQARTLRGLAKSFGGSITPAREAARRAPARARKSGDAEPIGA